MEHLFNFSPLFFYNPDHFLVSNRTILSDQKVRFYLTGGGYDARKNGLNTLGTVTIPDWIGQYFGDKLTDKVILPYRMTHLGQPLEAATNAQQARNSASQFATALAQKDINGASHPLADVFNFSDDKAALEGELTAKDAATFVNFMRHRFEDSASSQSISGSLLSQYKQYGDVINGVPVETKIVNENAQYSAQQKFALESIDKYASLDQLSSLINLAMGRTKDGPARTADVDLAVNTGDWNVSQTYAAMPRDSSARTQLLYDTVARKIKMQSQLPAYRAQADERIAQHGLFFSKQEMARDAERAYTRFSSLH